MINLIKISEYFKDYEKFLIWICLPLILFLLPIIVRLVFVSGYYFIHANLALSAVILALIYYHYRQHRNVTLLKFGAILALFFFLLTLLDTLKSYPEITSAQSLYEIMRKDIGIQEALGITEGFASIFVFLIATRISRHLSLSENVLQGFRTIAGMAAVLSIITTLGLFGVQAQYTIKWIFQIVIIGGGLFVGIFSFSIGIIYGGSKNAVLSLIGLVVVFVIGLIFGIAVIVFTGKGEVLYLSQFSFAANFNLIIGLFLYTLEMSETPWKEYLGKILGEDFD